MNTAVTGFFQVNSYCCLPLHDSTSVFNPLTAKLFNLNFHPLEVVSR